MAKVIYGYWDNKKIDNRDKFLFEIEDDENLRELNFFEPGNEIKAFIGWKGFFIFDKKVNIIETFTKYMTKIASESCGKCTPCRVGTKILAEQIKNLKNSTNLKEDIDNIKKLAIHISQTSLCGLGQTSTIGLLTFLDNFEDELKNEVENKVEKKSYNEFLYMTAPCIEACPAKVEVPKYIDYIRDGKFSHSVGVVLQKYPWAATCGRVCVRFCEFACRRTVVDAPVGIKTLKRFVADKEKYVTDGWFTKDLIKEKKPEHLKVAIIGSGPASISAAYHLLLRGYHVDIFEAMTEPGGMAAIGIPNYRLPKDILRKEISIIESLGGNIFYNRRLGVDFYISDLFKQGYKSIFLGIGASKGKALKVPGENRSLKGYKTGINFLLYINHYYINMGLKVELGDKIVVVGGGNVAMDCVRSAIRMGAKEVHLVYRRTEEQMPADREEIEAAKEEGVIFHFLTNPSRIISENGKVTGIELVKMQLGEPDESGRRSVSAIEGSEFIMSADMIIPAIGQYVDLSFLKGDEGIEINRWGLIKVNEDTLMTSKPGVFAGGDAVSGPATLIEAMAAGIKAASSIDDYLSYGKVRFSKEDKMSKILKALRIRDKEEIKIPIKYTRRIKVEELEPSVRKKIFDEVEKPIKTEDAYKEAERCLRCYRLSMVLTER